MIYASFDKKAIIRISFAIKATLDDVNDHSRLLVFPSFLASITLKKSFANIIYAISLFTEALQYILIRSYC